MGLFSKKQQTPPVIDLRESEQPQAVARSSSATPPVARRARAVGYLDHIDPFKRIQYEHCPSCFTKWQLTEDELVALNS